MLDRRTFLAGVVVVVAAPLAAEAQQAGKMWRIGLIGTDDSELPGHAAFRQALRDLGAVDPDATEQLLGELTRALRVDDADDRKDQQRTRPQHPSDCGDRTSDRKSTRLNS